MSSMWNLWPGLINASGDAANLSQPDPNYKNLTVAHTYTAL